VLTQAISLKRLMAYERECRRQAMISRDQSTRDECTKLGESFHRVIGEIEAELSGDSSAMQDSHKLTPGHVMVP